MPVCFDVEQTDYPIVRRTIGDSVLDRGLSERGGFVYTSALLSLGTHHQYQSIARRQDGVGTDVNQQAASGLPYPWRFH